MLAMESKNPQHEGFFKELDLTIFRLCAVIFYLGIELIEEYLKGAVARFETPQTTPKLFEREARNNQTTYYKIPLPGSFNNRDPEEPFPKDGGKKRKTD